jgi:hypothetical protein
LTARGADAAGLGPRQSSRAASSEVDLGSLLAAVLRARAAQSEIRQHPGRHVDSLMMARRACLKAIEEYTAALKSRRLPIPYQMHMELALLRTVCGSARGDLERTTTAKIKSAPKHLAAG